MTADAIVLPPLANQFSYFFRLRDDLERWWTATPMVSLPTGNAHLVSTVLQALVAHHEALRILWVAHAQGLHQIVLPRDDEELAIDTPNDVARLDAVSDVAARWMEGVRASCTWEQPLYRAFCLQVEDGTGRFILMVHHSIADAFSKRILMEDFERLYFAVLRGESASLSSEATCYSEFARQSGQFWAERWEEELAYWSSLPWSRVQSLTSLGPADMAERNLERHTVDVVRYVRTPPGNGENKSAHRELNGWIPLLLCGIGRAYCEWTGYQVLCLALVVHGREPFKPGINLARTVGWLSETVPILIKPTPIDAEFVRSVQNQLYQVLIRGKSYGVLRYVANTPARTDLANHPDPQLSLNVLPTRFSAPWRSSFERVERVAAVTAGAARSLRVFVMSGGASMHEGEVRLNWEFSDRVLEREQVQAFTDACCGQFRRLLLARAPGQGSDLAPAP